MLARHPELDLVIIAAPIPYHEEMLAVCFEYAVAVYVEKPPVPTLPQLERLIEQDIGQRVSVGFQMIGMPTMVALRQWIDEGRLGTIHQITAGASWPRETNYYERAAWAGKLEFKGMPVVDGPASNALSHVLQNIMFLAASPGDARFAEPEWLEAGFYRARPIESYDLASIHGGFANGIEFTTVLSHCTAEAVPAAVIVLGSKGQAWISQDGARLDSNFNVEPIFQPANAYDLTRLQYQKTLAWLAGETAAPPVSLADCRGYLKAVGGGLLSSNGIHSIPQEYLSTVLIESIWGNGKGLCYDVKGLADAIRSTLETNQSLEAQNIPWACKGDSLQGSEIYDKLHGLYGHSL
jgi:predicted dehydrogenase